MIYIVVIAAVVLIPSKLGGYARCFAAADQAFQAKAQAAFCSAPASTWPTPSSRSLGARPPLYPHTLTGILASQSGIRFRKNAVLLPA